MWYTSLVTTSTNLAEALRRGYEHALDQPFLVTPGRRASTYRETESLADAMAGALVAHGVATGDRVVAKTAKSPEAIALYLACLRLGAVYVPLNPGFTAAEQQFFVDDAEPSVFVNEPGDEPQGRVATLTLGADGDGSLIAAADAATPRSEIVPTGADDTVVMLYTSGTTGRSKGAMLTNRGLLANGRALHDSWGFTPHDVLLHPLPIFHAHGLFVAMHCAMLSGCAVHFLPRFTVDAALDELPACTVMMAVPTIYSRLLADERFDAGTCAAVRLFTSGSAPMTAQVHEAFTSRTGHRILERYGMTEAGMITSNPLDGARVPGTVGFALPGYEVRVATDEGPCAPEETGVVEIRGPHLFSGYWKLPDRTAEEFRPDGFFVTGDVGTMDREGRLTLQGRSGDMIISGGENIYPKEIEQCLDSCAGIEESAVIGVPHADFGETVVAFLVTNDDYDPGLVASQVHESLARFKHPRRYELVEELPRNAMGKIQKRLLRERASS